MTASFFWLLATIAAALLIPALFLAWVFETRDERVRRLARSGWSQRRIADHMGITRYRVQRALA
jgi:hypothetical protein